MSIVTILVIEDEESIQRFLRVSLTAQGYKLEVAWQGKEGITLAATSAPDLILLDLGLPDMDGLEVLAALRLITPVPIIILSARGRERDKVDALDAGAHDYLTKPFGVAELGARIRAALRHAVTPQAGPRSALVASGDLHIDLDQRTVTKAGRLLHLTPNEYKLLATLARYQGRVVTQSQIIKTIWGTDRPGLNQHLRVYIHQLRHKIEDEPAQPRYLLTEPWVGFRLVSDADPDL